MNCRIIHSKKGVAIEMAVSMMMVVFAMCTLFITLMYISKKDVQEANEKFGTDAAIEQIGENFVRYAKTNPNVTGFTNINSDYKTNVTVANDPTDENVHYYTLKVMQAKKGSYVVLVIKVKQKTNTVTVTENEVSTDKTTVESLEILSWGRE